MASGGGRSSVEPLNDSTIMDKRSYIQLPDGSFQVLQSFLTPEAPALQRFDYNSPQIAAKITEHLPGGGIQTLPASAVTSSDLAASARPLFSRDAGFNMAAPTLNTTTDNNSAVLQIVNQHIANTAVMCNSQQKAISELTKTVLELKNLVQNSQKIDSDCQQSDQVQLQETVDSDSSDECEEDESVLDIDEPVPKRQKLSSESEIASPRSNLDKLKQINSKLRKSEELAEPVHEVVAQTVNQALSVAVDHKGATTMDLCDRYKRPNNCEYLQVPKVNKILWKNRQTKKQLKDSDKLFQRTQTYLTSGLLPLVQIMNKTLMKDNEDAAEIFDLAVDSFNLLAFSHRDLSNQRRRLLLPAISDKYRQICTDTDEFSPDNLFGGEEEIEKKMKAIDDSRKLSNSLTAPQHKNQNYGKSPNKTVQRNNFSKIPTKQNNFYQNRNAEHDSRPGTSRDFLGKKARDYNNQNSRKHQGKKGFQGHHK